MWILITLCVAALGGGALLRAKVPAGMLIGAILGACCLNLAGGSAYMYPQARVLAQTLTGAYIGCTVTRKDLRRLPGMIGPYLMVMASLLALNLCVGIFLYWATDHDLLTCLFCTAPGGLSDMPLIAADMGADGSMVAVMQLIRTLFGMGCLPKMILLSDRLMAGGQTRAGCERAEPHEKDKKKGSATLRGFLPVFCVTLPAGVMGKLSGIPAGTFSAALLVSAALSLSKNRGVRMPLWLRRVAQVISGCCIGCAISREQLLQMRFLLAPAIVMCVGYGLCCVGMGIVIARIFHMDVLESMLALSPVAPSEMAFIAADMGIESANLVVLQLYRFVGVLLIFPHIFTLVLRLVA